MRKLGLVLGLLLTATFVQARSLDIFGVERPAVWRSSSTCTTLNFVQLATGSIVVHGISVDSPTFNLTGASYITMFNSTTPPNGSNSGNFFSTGPVLNMNATSNMIVLDQLAQYDMFFGSGVVINKTAGACTTVLWDFLDSGIYYRPGASSFNPWRP